jgi:hypothetical protein
MLDIMIESAKLEGKFEGVVPYLRMGGYLYFSVRLSMDHNIGKAKNLKLLLSGVQTTFWTQN